MSSKKHLCNYKFLFLHLSLRIYRLRTTQVIFNGNGYDQDSQKMLTEKGLCRIDSGVDAMCRYTEPKNIKLFGDLGVTMSLFHLLPFTHVTSTLIFGLIILKLYWLFLFPAFIYLFSHSSAVLFCRVSFQSCSFVLLFEMFVLCLFASLRYWPPRNAQPGSPSCLTTTSGQWKSRSVNFFPDFLLIFYSYVPTCRVSPDSFFIFHLFLHQ